VIVPAMIKNRLIERVKNCHRMERSRKELSSNGTLSLTEVRAPNEEGDPRKSRNPDAPKYANIAAHAVIFLNFVRPSARWQALLSS